MTKLDKETKDVNGGIFSTNPNVKIVICTKCKKSLMVSETAKTATCSCGNKFTINN